MSSPLRDLDDDDLVRVSLGHPLVRHLLPHRVRSEPGWSCGQAVALVSDYWQTPHGGDLIMVGPADDAAALARLLVGQGRSMSLPRAGYDLLPAGLLAEPSPWSFRWTDAATGVTQDAAEWVVDPSAVEGLLDAAFPEASFRPSSLRVRGWAGNSDDQGLIACAADTTEAPGVGFVAAIATRPDLRGQGLGARITGWTLDRLVEREGLAALWHYGGNLAAARTYDSLGMHLLEMTAGRPS